MNYQRGDIVWANLPEICPGIQAGKRPVLVISNDKCNQYSPVINVIPFTTKIKRRMPTHVEITGIDKLKDSVAMAEQIMLIHKDVLGQKITKCNSRTLGEIENAMYIQLH